MQPVRTRILVLTVTLALSAAACASTPDAGEEVALEQTSPSPAASGGPAAPGGSPSGTPGDGTGDRKPDDKGSQDDGEGGGKEPAGGGPGPGSERSAPGGGTEVDDGGGDGAREPSGGDRASGGRGALAPAPGSYVYSQSGFEEFCSASCDRQALPKRQVVDTAVPQRSSSSATVVTEMKASRSRMSRTTTRYTRGGAFVTEVYVRFTYAGYTFEQTYRPSPQVEALRFPLTTGSSWSGSWKGKVSGSYSVSVGGRETVRAAGRTVEAIRVETSTRFRGDFKGRANATVWVDPRTKALVKTAGNLNVASAYGRYATGFATTLSSGPGY